MPKCIPIPDLTNRQLASFWARIVQKSDSACWTWLGSCTKAGYGRLKLNGIMYYATRVMLALDGQKSTDLEVCHSCNNPSCVNPKHLRFGTHFENIQDRKNIGLGYPDQWGSKNYMAKLTEADIPDIKKLYKTTTQLEIAKLYGVSSSLINQIIVGRIWKHVASVV